MQVLDAYDRPDAAATQAAGFGGAFGYLLGSKAKDTTAAEIADYSTLDYAIVAEGSSTDLGFGHGASVGATAAAQAKDVGWPTDGAIYFTVDRGVPSSGWGAIAADLDAAGRASGHPVGIYGGGPLVEAMILAGHARFGWIAGAPSWSGVSTAGRTPDEVNAELRATAPHAHVLQRYAGGVTVGGHQCDINDVLADDFGQLPRPTQQEDDDEMRCVLVTPKAPHPDAGSTFHADAELTWALFVPANVVPMRQTIYALNGHPQPTVTEIDGALFDNMVLIDRDDALIQQMTGPWPGGLDPLKALCSGGGGGPVDVDAIATAVADLLAARLKD